MPAGKVRVQVRIHPSGNWMYVPVTVGGLHDLAMVLDTGSPASVISPAARDELLAKHLALATMEPNRYLLANLTASGQALPALSVRVWPRIARLGIDGLLGLDFLRRFRRIEFMVDDLLLTLEDP